MGTTFFILPHDPEIWVAIEDNDQKFKSDLAINLDDFAQQLVMRWPKANFEIVTRENSKEIKWSIPDSSPNSCFGSLIHYSIIELDSCHFEVVLEFANWYRGYVPSKYRLFIMIPAGESIELTEHTTAQDIRRAFWIE
jgi:hypothetical protein